MQTDPIESISYREYSILWGQGGDKYLSKDGLVCFYKNSDGMPRTGLKCLNANFISYATQVGGLF